MSNLVEVVLPAEVNAVEVRDIPGLLANAIHPQTESASKIVSALKKQIVGPDGFPLPDLHPLTSKPLHDRTSPEQRLLEAIFVAPPGEESAPFTDWALLNLAWEGLPDFRLPLPEAEWTKYADAWEKSMYRGNDWRLFPEWDTERGHAFTLNMQAEAAHRAELSKAIKSGSIVPRSPVTRLPEPLADGEGLRTGLVLVEEFRCYAGRFEIGVTLAPDTQARVEQEHVAKKLASWAFTDEAYKEDPVLRSKYTRAVELLTEQEKWERMDHKNDPDKAEKIEAKLTRIRAELAALDKPLEDSLNTEVAPPAPNKHKLKMRMQKEAILDWLTASNFDPKNLPPREKGKAGPRSEVRAAMLLMPSLFSESSFDKAWESLRKDKEIIGAE